MIYFLKGAAALLVLICARCICSEYNKFSEKKLALYEGFLSLISFIKNELSCRGRATFEWAAEFENDSLYDAGFISALRESGSLHTAFSSLNDDSTGLGNDAKKLLDGYFASFGKSYKSDEEGEACRVFSELSRIFNAEREHSSKSVRAVKTLSYAVALGVIVLLL